jgi:hypothetical protein
MVCICGRVRIAVQKSRKLRAPAELPPAWRYPEVILHAAGATKGGPFPHKDPTVWEGGMQHRRGGGDDLVGAHHGLEQILPEHNIG